MDGIARLALGAPLVLGGVVVFWAGARRWRRSSGSRLQRLLNNACLLMGIAVVLVWQGIVVLSGGNSPLVACVLIGPFVILYALFADPITTVGLIVLWRGEKLRNEGGELSK